MLTLASFLPKEQKLVADCNAKQADVMRLDVGGTNFHVSRHVLTSQPDCMLDSMFSGRFHLETQADGTIFIDRYPQNYLACALRLLCLHKQFLMPSSPQGPTALPRDIGLPSWGGYSG